MYEGLKHAHSGLRWVILIALIYAIAHAIRAKKAGQPFSKGKIVGTLAVSSLHLQFLLGLAIYFQSPWWESFKASASGAIKVADIRFYAIEHPVMMLAAVILATIGNARAKRAATDDKAYRTRAIFFSITLIVILLAIPWPFRFAGATWF